MSTPKFFIFLFLLLTGTVNLQAFDNRMLKNLPKSHKNMK